MDDSERIAAYWHMYDDNLTQSRHHESERGVIVGVVVTIGAALAGLITFDGIIAGMADAVLSLFLFFVGIFGAGFNYKNYERSCYHFSRARGFRDELDTKFYDGRIKEIQTASDDVHYAKFASIRKFRLHIWWVLINLAIALLAVVLIFMALIAPIGL